MCGWGGILGSKWTVCTEVDVCGCVRKDQNDFELSQMVVTG